MKNILSYKKWTPISGKEIKEWIRYNLENETSHSKTAKKMEKYLNIDDNTMYFLNLTTPTSGCGEVRDTPMVTRCNPESVFRPF